jgi:hypothetical protein
LLLRHAQAFSDVPSFLNVLQASVHQQTFLLFSKAELKVSLQEAFLDTHGWVSSIPNTSTDEADAPFYQ